MQISLKKMILVCLLSVPTLAFSATKQLDNEFSSTPKGIEKWAYNESVNKPIISSQDLLNQINSEINSGTTSINKIADRILQIQQILDAQINQLSSAEKEAELFRKSHMALRKKLSYLLETQKVSKEEFELFVEKNFEPAKQVMSSAPYGDYNERIVVSTHDFANIVLISEKMANVKESNTVNLWLFIGFAYYHGYGVDLDFEKAENAFIAAWRLHSDQGAGALSKIYSEYNEPEKAYFWGVRSGMGCFSCEKKLTFTQMKELQKDARNDKLDDISGKTKIN